MNHASNISRLTESEGQSNSADALVHPTAQTLEVDSIFTPGEAAGSLRISIATLLRLSRTGEIPGVRVGKLWRYRKSDLDEWLASKVSSFRHPCRK